MSLFHLNVVGDQDPCVLVSFEIVKDQTIVGWIINDERISQEFIAEGSQNEMVIRNLDSNQSGFKPIDVIFEGLAAPVGYFEEAIYSLPLLNADSKEEDREEEEEVNEGGLICGEQSGREGRGVLTLMSLAGGEP